MEVEFDLMKFEVLGNSLISKESKQNELFSDEEEEFDEDGTETRRMLNENAPRESLIWVIEVQKGLFEEFSTQNEDNSNEMQSKSCYYKEIILTFLQHIKKNIISNVNDKNALIFFNTLKSNNELSLPGIYVYFPLSFMDSNRLKNAKKLICKTYTDFVLEFGIANTKNNESAHINDLFTVCGQIFTSENLNYKSNLISNKTFFFTMRDNPTSSINDKTHTLQRAIDFQNKISDFKLFPLEIPGEKFDMNKFYRNIIVDENFFETQENNAKKNFDGHVFLKSSQSNRCLYVSNVLEICEGFEVSIDVYSQIVHCKRPPFIYVNALDNKPLKSISKCLRPDDGTELSFTDIIQYLPLNDNKILINANEKKKLNDYGCVGMKLIGFKPLSFLDTNLNVSHAFFVYPNDKIIKESSTFLAPLMHTMHLKLIMAIVAWVPSEKSQLRFAALIPQLEEVDESHNQLTPPGFYLLPLPYSDDIRCVPVSSTCLANEDDSPCEIKKQIALAENVLKLLMIDSFSHEQIENPVLQRHYAVLEMLALGEQEVREVRDDLQPQYEQFESIKNDVLEWRNSIYKDEEYVDNDNVTSSGKNRNLGMKKRNLAVNLDNEITQNKYVKINLKNSYGENNETNVLDDKTVKSYVFERRVNKLSITQLKAWLAHKNLPCSGNKPTLISKVESFFGVRT